MYYLKKKTSASKSKEILQKNLKNNPEFQVSSLILHAEDILLKVNISLTGK